jgi:hypothetical protein
VNGKEHLEPTDDVAQAGLTLEKDIHFRKISLATALALMSSVSE